MDAQTINTLISNLGFPIVVSIVLFRQLNKSNEKHAEEIEELRKTIENNTLIITRLYERMESSKNGTN